MSDNPEAHFHNLAGGMIQTSYLKNDIEAKIHLLVRILLRAARPYLDWKDRDGIEKPRVWHGGTLVLPHGSKALYWTVQGMKETELTCYLNEKPVCRVWHHRIEMSCTIEEAARILSSSGLLLWGAVELIPELEAACEEFRATGRLLK